MTNHTAVSGTGAAPDAAVAALGAAVQDVISSFEGDIPFGAAAGVLERIKAVHAQIDALKLAILQPLCSVHNRLKYRRNTRRCSKTKAGAGAKTPLDGKAPLGPPGAAGPPTG